MAGKSMRQPGWLYVLSENTAFLKIGITLNDDVQKRKRQLQAGNPRKLYVIRKIQVRNCKICEDWIHSMFDRWRLEGEWFHINDISVFDSQVDKLGDLVIK